jgi:hypothetical protein
VGLTFADVITAIIAIPAMLISGLTIYCLLMLAKELIVNRR